MPGARRKVKVTKKLIAECAPLKKEYAVCDTACDGLHAGIFPSRAKSFAVFYGDDRGRQRRRSLGGNTAVSVYEARKRAQAKIADARRGFDPFDDIDKRKLIPKLEEVRSNYLSTNPGPFILLIFMRPPPCSGISRPIRLTWPTSGCRATRKPARPGSLYEPFRTAPTPDAQLLRRRERFLAS